MVRNLADNNTIVQPENTRLDLIRTHGTHAAIGLPVIPLSVCRSGIDITVGSLVSFNQAFAQHHLLPIVRTDRECP
jgi:hypothetical protein